MKKLLLTIASLALMLGASFAHDYKVGELIINHPVMRETPANAPVSGGYMIIKNNGSEADRLLAVEVDFAGKSEIHQMSMSGDVMKMRKLEEGLEIPAGGEVKLMPGSYHLMFMQLEKQLTNGEKYDATLIFEKSGSVDVTLNVETLEEIKKSLGGETMDHSHHGMEESETKKAE